MSKTTQRGPGIGHMAVNQANQVMSEPEQSFPMNAAKRFKLAKKLALISPKKE